MMQNLCLLVISGVLFATVIMAQKCPAPGEGFGVCVEACTNDSDCKTGQLCCSNGCGHECMSPVDHCATVRCAAPKCHELSAGTITPEGKCCPVCACAATDGTMVPAGTSFMNDCNRCLCGSKGLAACTRRACPPTTKPPTPPTTATTTTGTTSTTTTGTTTTTTATDVTLPTSSPAVKCPNTTGLFGTCEERCSGDDECSDGQLCCSNGCGHACMDPVVDCAAVLCLRPNCSSLSALVTPKGSCCPVCGCRTPNGDGVAPGETYRPDSCNTCTCFRNGLAACTLAFCPPPTNSTPTPTTDKSTATPSVTPTEPTTQNCSVTKVAGRVSHNRRRQRTRLTFSSDDDQRVTYKCKLDDEKFEDCTSPLVWRNLERGRHTITVRVFCSDDRSISARRRFRVRVR